MNLDNALSKKPFAIFFVNVAAFILAYYICILLHEWGHGTTAWLLGQKSSPFDIQYGGWMLLHADENVNYAYLHATNQGVSEAIIGISGITISLILFISCLILLNSSKIQKNIIFFVFVYWALAINMVPILQYLSLMTFSKGGDVGHFIRGLNISPWWIFIPGTLIVISSLWWILRVEVPKAYTIISIRSLWGRRLFLLATLIVIFFLIYTHGYNPLIDPATNLPSKILSVFSLLLVPMLLILCDPSHRWVRISIQKMQKNCHNRISDIR